MSPGPGQDPLRATDALAPGAAASAAGPAAAPAPAGDPHLASRIARNTGLLAVTNLLVRALGMGLMIFLARYLGAEGYGTYQRSEAFVFLFSILANLGLDVILTREVAQGEPRTPEYLGGVLTLKVVLGLITYSVILAVAHSRGYTGTFLWGIRIYGLVLILLSMAQAMESVFQGRQVMVYQALANLANQVAFLVLGLTCILLGKDLRWILSTLVVSALVRLSVSTALLRRLGVRWQRPGARTLGFLLRESLPLAFAASFVIVYQQVDAVMLGEMKGNAQVGWYKAGAKFLLVFVVLRESFLMAVYPVFASLARTDRERLGGLVTRVVRYQGVVALYFVMCFVLLSRVAPKLLGAEFQNSATVLPIMAWVLVPQVLSVTAGRLMIAAGHQRQLIVTTGLSLVVNVTCNLLLIPRYGFLGAATSSVMSETVVAALNLYYVNRLVARTAVVRALAKPALAAALVGGALYFLRGLHLYLAFPLAAALYLAALLALRTFSRAELDQFGVLAAAGWRRLTGRRDPPGGGGGAGISWLGDRRA